MAARDTPRLLWSSKPQVVDRTRLPFQVVETINESRATREAESGSLFRSTQLAGEPTWRNKLIWGDNKLVAASLLAEFAGQITLVYIDPPFDTGTDFSFRVQVGDQEWTKEPSILESHAYSDTWGAGRSSYLRMMYERLVLIWELLADDGSLYLHCAPNVSHYLKVLCDEIFGSDRARAEIVWKRVSGHGDAKKWSPVHEIILHYSKGPTYIWNAPREPLSESYTNEKYDNDDGDGRGPYQLDNLTSPNPRPNMMYEWKGFPWPAKGWRYSQATMAELDADGRIWYPEDKSNRPRLKRYLEENEGRVVDDVWNDIPPVNSQALERTGFDTQKPVALLERIIESSSTPGNLVADFFAGSGTTAVTAEQLGRRWIAVDIGRFGVHITRKRLLSVPGCKPFEVLNLGSYERQHWQRETAGEGVEAYLDFILSLYDAQGVTGYTHLHGKKADRLVHVGAVDAPVTIDEINDVMDELAANDLRSADVLGWEWEMGLHDVVSEEARRRGLDVICRQIPREVMKAESGAADIRFFELAYLDFQIDREGKSVRVQLRDFVIPSEDLIPDDVRKKITQWTDYIDYWSVDFSFRDDTFHNEWQTYRTREQPRLASESDWHDYSEPGRHAIVVKVIDIFGNDTTKLAEVMIR